MNSNQTLESDKLLHKLILQFAVYARGSNQLLDPYLDNLTQQIKNGVKFKDLIPELVPLSKTLAHLAVSETKATQANPTNDQLHQTYFITHLRKLLDETNIPVEFLTQCNRLKNKAKGKISYETYKEVVDSAMTLLLKIKNKASTEQQDIQSFLTNISNEFSSLNEHASYASDSILKTILNRTELNEAIDQQVSSIKNSSDEATELSSLQNSITQHVLELNLKLNSHKKSEDSRQQETQQQLELMSQKIQDLEVEADALRGNLKIEHDKALKDALTGLPNRLAYDERVMIEFKYWQRYKTPLSLIIWDIDLFKKINDTFGHKAGDKTLALVAQLILTNCKETDFISRFGGEEFVMLLPNTNSKQALIVANKIRTIISNSAFNHNGKLIQLTISCGISEYLGNNDNETVFEQADQALYSSKEQGRNQCSIIVTELENLQ